MTDTTIWESIANIPWWNYVLVIFLIQVGLRARKGHAISIKHLFVLPVFFACIGLLNFYISIPFTLANLSFWLAMIALGIVIGWLHFRLMKIKAIPNEAKLYVPGSWNFLIFIALVFVGKYFFPFDITFDPQTLLQQPKWMMACFLFFGFFTGFFTGRALYAWRCVKKGPYWVSASTCAGTQSANTAKL